MSRAGTHWRDLPTPAFVVDITKATANAARMQSIVDAAGALLRPHVKTHKCIEMLAILRDHGAGTAIVVSTLHEAEFFASVADDILLAVPYDPHKLSRSLDIARRVKTFGVTVDSPDALRQLLAGLTAVAVPPVITVWVEVDTGYHRCGVDITTTSTAEAVALVQEVVSASPAIAFGGLYAHSGHSYNCCPESGDPAEARAAAGSIAAEEGRLAFALAEELERDHGIRVPVISLGATPSVSCGSGHWPVSAAPQRPASGEQGSPPLSAPLAPPRLELHPGNFTFYDRQQVSSGSCSRADIACFVVAHVVGRYASRGELVLDCGSTALHKDPAGLADRTWGELADYPGLVLTKLTQVRGERKGQSLSCPHILPVLFSRDAAGACCRSCSAGKATPRR